MKITPVEPRFGVQSLMGYQEGVLRWQSVSSKGRNVTTKQLVYCGVDALRPLQACCRVSTMDRTSVASANLKPRLREETKTFEKQENKHKPSIFKQPDLPCVETDTNTE